ncbi:TetR/AcrR family transcriptional regulator [Microbacterium resistens]|uniref:TetR/AcrR family transcriptional regulator n=1 Tax=Microbacterium resistens TaxID=156977 RepID=UPI001C576014|nr:TetR/AcrR family transcriptional regulator [Microbacterium resistens]MBW1639436.1 TetR/AcrR family transcriptional regulator [Microbacterium resistens]
MAQRRDRPPAPASAADEAQWWATPRVAEVLGISRQAINARVRNRKLLAAPGHGVTLFPAWQFDEQTGAVRPEVAELLDAVDSGIPAEAIARWSVSPGPDAAPPGDLLRSPATKAEALRRARSLEPEALPAPRAEDADEVPDDVAGWMPARAESSEAQRAILLAAAELFARKGPAKTSLREIATAADVPYGLIHRHYQTKENLLVAVMQLLVAYGGERLSGEQDIYAAIDNSFGADLDAGQFGRMLTWAVFEGTPPERLLGGARSRGYRTQIEALWQDPARPTTPGRFDAEVLASLIALIGSVWNMYEPYFSALSDRADDPASREGLRREVADMLKLLVYATRPADGS